MNFKHDTNKTLACLTKDSDKPGHHYNCRSGLGGTFYRRVNQICIIGFLIGFVAAIWFSSSSQTISMLIVGVMAFLISIPFVVNIKPNYGMLCLSVVGLAVAVYMGGTLWCSAEINRLLSRYTPIVTMLLFVPINLLAIADAAAKRKLQIAGCTADALARCVDMQYQNREDGKTVFCPTLELSYGGAVYTLCDNVFTEKSSDAVQVGEMILIRFNPENPNEFYRQDERTMPYPITLNVIGIVFACVMLVILLTR